MSKIEEIVNNSLTEMEGKFHPYYMDGYGDGFDAAMDLSKDITFKYIEWANHTDFSGDDKLSEMNSDQLYDYFIEHIYTP